MSASVIVSSDFRKTLDQNLLIRAEQTGESLERLRRKVAFDRLLARIAT